MVQLISFVVVVIICWYHLILIKILICLSRIEYVELWIPKGTNTIIIIMLKSSLPVVILVLIKYTMAKIKANFHLDPFLDDYDVLRWSELMTMIIQEYEMRWERNEIE